MNDNPFSRKESLKIGKDIRWVVDDKAGLATKSISDGKGIYYHLRYDNKQLEVRITTDAGGLQPKQYTQLEVKDVQIDDRQSTLFMWCLNNQQSHNRFLQQGLTVKKDVCSVDGDAGSFVMQLNVDTLTALQNASELLILLKPYRTPLELSYDISDFRDMHAALNARPEPVAAKPVKTAAVKSKRKCFAEPPAKYINISPIEYACDDATAKNAAAGKLDRLIQQEQEKANKLAAEKERQRILAEQKKLEEMQRLEEKRMAEAAAIAASEAKRAQIRDEITEKMLTVCEKYWSKGEHRCYCQNYIEYAPAEIRANASCN